MPFHDHPGLRDETVPQLQNVISWAELRTPGCCGLLLSLDEGFMLAVSDQPPHEDFFPQQTRGTGRGTRGTPLSKPLASFTGFWLGSLVRHGRFLRRGLCKAIRDSTRPVWSRELIKAAMLSIDSLPVFMSVLPTAALRCVAFEKAIQER